jgi:mono/diheme cytochrome c family protein
VRVLGKLLAVVILLGAAYAVFAWTWGVPRVAEHPTLTDEESIARGRYLLVAGDCISCHTAPGAATLSGGFEVASPFGNIVAPNITPAKSGIAGMTSAQFYQIMAYGANSIWHPLYPAMPYTSFRLVTREDSDALHGYLMSLPPVENDVPPTSLMFPFNIRPGVFAWNLLFADRGTFVPDPAKDEAWNRGAYLVNGLGHCDACHTPRNMLMGEKSGEALKGGAAGGDDRARHHRRRADRPRLDLRSAGLLFHHRQRSARLFLRRNGAGDPQHHVAVDARGPRCHGQLSVRWQICAGGRTSHGHDARRGGRCGVGWQVALSRQLRAMSQGHWRGHREHHAATCRQQHGPAGRWPQSGGRHGRWGLRRRRWCPEPGWPRWGRCRPFAAA